MVSLGGCLCPSFTGRDDNPPLHLHAGGVEGKIKTSLLHTISFVDYVEALGRFQDPYLIRSLLFTTRIQLCTPAAFRLKILFQQYIVFQD